MRFFVAESIKTSSSSLSLSDETTGFLVFLPLLGAGGAGVGVGVGVVVAGEEEEVSAGFLFGGIKGKEEE